ncbi:hypothetical protein K491DRAFT_710809 [Lophiostoma macrostomum CBS 122681]|uniref:BTB domain-containing protein n=1 Tax=Lophiostoma macrostomum CBS 122681 TaxID=1314788 RepID=A0A6A6TSK2_9PLEO|nr:hypothetical protein K491DRAFT_710809 [Lophiostoma macrostomum CBS 122681]
MEHKDKQAKYTPKDIRTSQKAIGLSGPLIKVSLDDDTTLAIIHREILCATSGFFKSATKPEWSESRAEPYTIRLPVDRPVADAFPLYQHWLYCGTLPISGEPVPKVFEALAKAYILGEVLLDTQFRNDIIDTIVVTWEEYRHSPIGKPVAIIYEGTLPGSPARRLVSDMCAYIIHDHKSWTDELDDCPPDFCKDVLRAIAKLRGSDHEVHKPYPWKEFCESYHENEAV